MFENVRFSSQPIEDPETKEGLAPILDWMQATRTLMFSSDYPHFDWDDPSQAFSTPQELRERVFSANARESVQAIDVLRCNCPTAHFQRCERSFSAICRPLNHRSGPMAALAALCLALQGQVWL